MFLSPSSRSSFFFDSRKCSNQKLPWIINVYLRICPTVYSSHCLLLHSIVDVSSSFSTVQYPSQVNHDLKTSSTKFRTTNVSYHHRFTTDQFKSNAFTGLSSLSLSSTAIRIEFSEVVFGYTRFLGISRLYHSETEIYQISTEEIPEFERQVCLYSREMIERYNYEILDGNMLTMRL